VSTKKKRTWFPAVPDEEIKEEIGKFRTFDKWVERNQTVSDEHLREQINI
jgi:hypothetical protein